MNTQFESNLQVPDFLPNLIGGASAKPEDGGCLMQFVSFLFDEGWTDQPVCTNRHLANLAVAVNDNISDIARPRLARFAPYLMNTNPPRTLDSPVPAGYVHLKDWNSVMTILANYQIAVATSPAMLYDPGFNSGWTEERIDSALIHILAGAISLYRRTMRELDYPVGGTPISVEAWDAAVSLVGAAA